MPWRPHTYAIEVIPIAISLGVASPGTGEVTRKEELMHTAAAALYRAKETGRNRYVVAYGDQVFRCPQDDEPLQSDTAFSRY